MKLLLDENLSDRIIFRIGDLFPGSMHVKTVGLSDADDDVVWERLVGSDLRADRISEAAHRKTAVASEMRPCLPCAFRTNKFRARSTRKNFFDPVK